MQTNKDPTKISVALFDIVETLTTFLRYAPNAPQSPFAAHTETFWVYPKPQPGGGAVQRRGYARHGRECGGGSPL